MVAYNSRNNPDNGQLALVEAPQESARKDRISPKNTVKKLPTKSANEKFLVHFEENVTTK